MSAERGDGAGPGGRCALPPFGRFALLEHAAGETHHDLLLELVPGADPDERSLAAFRVEAAAFPRARGEPVRRIEDHRRLYLVYEGELSRGRGSVRRADGGVYLAEAAARDASGGPSQTRLFLDGARLRGAFLLPPERGPLRLDREPPPAGAGPRD